MFWLVHLARWLQQQCPYIRCPNSPTNKKNAVGSTAAQHVDSGCQAAAAASSAELCDSCAQQEAGHLPHLAQTQRCARTALESCLLSRSGWPPECMLQVGVAGCTAWPTAACGPWASPLLVVRAPSLHTLQSRRRTRWTLRLAACIPACSGDKLRRRQQLASTCSECNRQCRQQSQLLPCTKGRQVRPSNHTTNACAPSSTCSSALFIQLAAHGRTQQPAPMQHSFRAQMLSHLGLHSSGVEGRPA